MGRVSTHVGGKRIRKTKPSNSKYFPRTSFCQFKRLGWWGGEGIRADAHPPLPWVLSAPAPLPLRRTHIYTRAHGGSLAAATAAPSCLCRSLCSSRASIRRQFGQFRRYNYPAALSGEDFKPHTGTQASFGVGESGSERNAGNNRTYLVLSTSKCDY